MMNESLPQGGLGRTNNRALERGMVSYHPLGNFSLKIFSCLWHIGKFTSGC
jgi:hypothetical protein